MGRLNINSFNFLDNFLGNRLRAAVVLERWQMEY